MTRLAAALADRYRIERELGAGGMATVYLARDLKHDRDVALKVLKPELAAVLGAERFIVEIKTTAALQHPHILPLFDSGTADGFLYYVMPFIDGETLRTKLDRETQLGVDESVRVACDVAEALQYAHEHGVIHRDIKPENILLANGRPMVADFGIALAVSAAAGGRMTETGLSLGTPHYMSPEQATAEKDITARSDVYSLASVLYEMLSGEPPHMGNSAQQIIMKIIAETVAPVTKLRKAVPQNVAAALSKALEKLPADRFTSARAFADALTNPAYTNARSRVIAQQVVPTGTRRIAMFATAAIAVAALAGAYFIGRSTSKTATDQQSMTFYASVPDSVTGLARCCGMPLAISPDGRTLVFVGMTDGVTGSLYRVDFDQLQARVIPGTENGASPFFSPSGEWLGFEAEGTIKKVRLNGGPAEIVAVSGGSISSATWTDRDQIVYAVTPMANTLFTVNASGQSAPVMLLKSDSTPVSFLPYPFALPGGRAVLSATAGERASVLAERRLVLVHLETGRVDTLGIGTNATYADGHLFIGGANGTLSVQPFDATRLVATGERTTILSGLARVGPWMQAFAVSAGGSLAYIQADSSATGQQYLALMVTGLESTPEVTGGRAVTTAEPLPLPDPRPNALFEPAVSPDGNRVVYQVPNQNAPSRSEAVGDLYMYDVKNRTTLRFTSNGALGAVWTPDGKHVTYFAPGGNGRPRGIFSRAADLSGAPELIVDGELKASAWTPDGRLLLTKYHALSRTRQIGIIAPGDSAPQWLFPVSVNASQPVVSADGIWLAYTRDNRIWMQPLEGAGEPIQVSAGHGAQPRWSRTGRILYYVSLPERTLVAATFSGATVSSRTPISTQMASMGTDEGSVNWDIFPDGRRAIFTQPVQGGESQKLAVVQHWPALLRTTAAKK